MKLRFFFDAGSGICLWAADEAAREKYGYPVALEALPLDSATVSRGEDLIRNFDTSLDWNDPTGPSPWSDADRSKFVSEATDFHRVLAEKLGDTFEVLNELRA